MLLKSSLINKTTIYFITYVFFVSYFIPLLNFNDLYIVKFLDVEEDYSYVLKIDNESIFKAYAYVTINFFVVLILYLTLAKKLILDIKVNFNQKYNILTNIILACATIFLIILKVNNLGSENLKHIFIQLFFFHSIISFIFNLQGRENLFLRFYYLLILFIIIMYEVFITNQIFMVYLFFISSLYFVILKGIKFRRIIIYILLITTLLFSLNFFKIFFKSDAKLDIDFVARCNFVTFDKKDSCGQYNFNTEEFKNNIVPVPPSTFKLLYKVPESFLEYNIYSAINRGFERLLKMNYLASDIASIDNKFGDEFKNTFLNGKTYELLSTKFIPRLVYPDKPTENFGQVYAKKFHYLPKQDNTTSINLNPISESYINFGFVRGSLVYPVSVTLILCLILYLIRFMSNEFKILMLISIPILFTNSIEANTSGWIGGVVSYIFLILIFNFTINNNLLKKINYFSK